jgi:hypothetical protein
MPINALINEKIFIDASRANSGLIYKISTFKRQKQIYYINFYFKFEWSLENYLIDDQ